MATTQTLTLTDFLLARIAEDEAQSRDLGADAMSGWRWKHYPEDAYYELQSYALGTAERALAECETKRRIVKIATDQIGLAGSDVGNWNNGRDMAERSLRALALPYADHPDYRDEWRP